LPAQKGIQQAALAGIVVHDEDAGRFVWHRQKLVYRAGGQKKICAPIIIRSFRLASLAFQNRGRNSEIRIWRPCGQECFGPDY
jgi:hypothetical protein